MYLGGRACELVGDERCGIRAVTEATARARPEGANVSQTDSSNQAEHAGLRPLLWTFHGPAGQCGPSSSPWLRLVRLVGLVTRSAPGALAAAIAAPAESCLGEMLHSQC